MNQQSTLHDVNIIMRPLIINPIVKREVLINQHACYLTVAVDPGPVLLVWRAWHGERTLPEAIA
jgi:hypothetical protein